ncbi:hypothetical protein STEG23_030395 [Scotinomys teguina]
MWRTEDPLPRRRSWGAQVLLIEAQPVDGVRPSRGRPVLPAPGTVDAAGRPDVRVRTLPAPASARIAG